MRIRGRKADREFRAQMWPRGYGVDSQLSPLACRRSGAFTLIEIMIVVGMIAIIMAWGLPSFVHTLQKDPMRQALNDITDGLKEARAQAILNGTPSEFVIRAEGGQLAVQQVGGVGSEQAVAGTSGGHSGFSARLSDDIAIEMLDVNFRDMMQAGEAHVRFHPNGTSDEFTIVIRSLAGEWRKISLEVTTGLPDWEVIK